MNKDEIVEHMVKYIEDEERELQNKEKLSAKEKNQFVKKILKELEQVMEA